MTFPSLLDIHTHEATGSSPVVSTKIRWNCLISADFFCFSELFGGIDICETHNPTHTGKRAERTKQHRGGRRKVCVNDKR